MYIYKFHVHNLKKTWQQLIMLMTHKHKYTLYTFILDIQDSSITS